jgi:hypothetical protein
MICSSMNPDQLVSWGHAPTQELAEQAAQNELKDLSSGLTPGGRVSGQSKSLTPLTVLKLPHPVRRARG